MSARSFRSVFMVASCAGAALGCYLVSLRVAAERAQLEDVEAKIVLAQRDMRVLQTEIGTRGRLSQLERWNASALALSAPAANQFINGGYELARLAQPDRKVDFQAPVVLASAPQPSAAKPPIGEPATDDSGIATSVAEAAPVALTPAQILHQASFKTETREVPVGPAAHMPQAAGPKPTVKPAAAAKPELLKPQGKPGLAAAQPVPKKSVDKPQLAAAKTVTKPVRIAKTDPLAPLPARHVSKPTKDSATDR